MIKKSKNTVVFQAPKKPRSFLRFIYFSLFITFFALSGIFISTTIPPQQVYSADNVSVIIPPQLLNPTIPPTPVLQFSTFSTIQETTPIASVSPSVSSPEINSGEFCLNVPVLMYHHIQPLSIASLLGHEQLTIDSDIFKSQMEYLSENKYNVISAEDLAQALIKHNQLPPKSIVITIDDGYDDSYTYAFMLAKKYNLIMNFMIPTGLIGKPGYMNWDHLKDMAGYNNIKIYNHTTTHAALGLLNKVQIESEVSTASADIETNLGQKNNIFTYPFGSFSLEVIDILKQEGFIAAYSTIDGREQCTSYIMTLHRTRIGNLPLSSYGI